MYVMLISNNIQTERLGVNGACTQVYGVCEIFQGYMLKTN